MSILEILGFLFATIGVILIPVGWAFSKYLWAFSFGSFILGCWLFWTERNERKVREIEKREGEVGGSVGQPMPSDIHDYTGWSKGGRSKNFYSSFEDFGDSD